MTIVSERDAALRSILALIAPGTQLRDGLERILRGNTGALVVLGMDKTVESLCTGGFSLEVEFSATRLRELAKMDGAVVLSEDGLRILMAAVHLMPDPTIPTSESGTRHRTAERVAIQAGFPVISVSQSMRIITLYLRDQRYALDHPNDILSRANQALATLERYKMRLDDAIANLTGVELEDVVTLRDVVAVVQRGEMVHRIADEIETMIIELGVDARLLRLQLDEIYGDVDDELDLVVADYLPPGRTAAETLAEMSRLDDDQVLDYRIAARTLHREGDTRDLEQEVAPKGLRLLHRVHRLPADRAAAIADFFGGLAKLQRATVADLMSVDDIDQATAVAIKDTLERVTESTILDQYS